MSKVDIKIPDIGDAGETTIIEVLVSEGDTVAVDDSLITLESDKASMEVPATDAGTIGSLTCKVGDTVNEGDVIGTLEAGSDDGDGGSGDESKGEDSDDESDSDGSGSAQSSDSGTSSGSGDEQGSSSGGGKSSGGESSGGGESIEVVVPDIGEAGGVEVIEVLVSEGDEVTEEQSLITLESDKASMEVPSPSAGTVESISVKVGDSVDEGSLVLMLKTAGSGDSSGGSSGDDAGSAKDSGGAGSGGSDGSSAQKSSGDDGASGKGGESAKDSQGSSGRGGASSGDSSNQGQGGGGGSAASGQSAHDKQRKIPDENIQKAHASPGVRRYAREHGADLAQIGGNGPKGRILKEDVTAFIKSAMERSAEGRGEAGAENTGGAGIPPIPAVDFSKFGETETVELGRINKLSAANLHRAWLNLPLVTHHDEADVTDMEAFRKQLKAEAKEGDPKVTGLAFHMKALVACLKAFPKVNSSMSADGQSLIYKKYFHVGIAVDTPNGLVVPVFKDVDKKSINELADEMSDMSKRARDKKLKPAEMQGASMTISSLGGIGGTAFTPLVNPPEVAILGITRARMQPVWNGEEFVPRLMCPLDMSYDHRVIDGADAARFMAHYCRTISDVKRLLL